MGGPNEDKKLVDEGLGSRGVSTGEEALAETRQHHT